MVYFESFKTLQCPFSVDTENKIHLVISRDIIVEKNILIFQSSRLKLCRDETILWSSPIILGVCSGQVCENSRINITISNFVQRPQNVGAKNDIVFILARIVSESIFCKKNNPMVNICKWLRCIIPLIATKMSLQKPDILCKPNDVTMSPQCWYRK